MTSDYTKSQSYKAGWFYKTWGELLMNPKTTVADLVEFGEANRAVVDIVFQSMAPVQPDSSNEIPTEPGETNG